MRTLAAQWSSQIALATFLKSVKERLLPLVENVKIDGALVACSNDCFVQEVQQYHVLQPLAAEMDRWPSLSRFWVQGPSGFPPMCETGGGNFPSTHPTNTADTSLGRHCSTLDPSQSSPYGSVQPPLPGEDLRPSKLPALRKMGSYPTTCATSSMLIGRDRSFRSWSVYQDKGPRWVGHRGLAVISMFNNFLTMYRNHTGASIDRVRGFGTLQEMPQRGQ